MIVEDDPQGRKLIRDLLQISGYTTLEASDGKQGVELARARKPDLILMDIRMPVMDGHEATKILKADDATKKIPVLAVTASAMAGAEERLLQEGFNGYIAKPIEIQELQKKVEEYLSQ